MRKLVHYQYFQTQLLVFKIFTFNTLIFCSPHLIKFCASIWKCSLWQHWIHLNVAYLVQSIFGTDFWVCSKAILGPSKGGPFSVSMILVLLLVLVKMSENWFSTCCLQDLDFQRAHHQKYLIQFWTFYLNSAHRKLRLCIWPYFWIMRQDWYIFMENFSKTFSAIGKLIKFCFIFFPMTQSQKRI